MSLSGDAAGDALDEELDAPQRSWWRVGWVACVLAVGLVIWALSRPNQAPSPRPVVIPAPAVSTPARPVCPPPGHCSVRVGVPASIARLARAYLPSGVRLRVRTVVAAATPVRQNLLVARDIDARLDSVTVLIRVRRGGSGAQEIAPDPLGVGSLLLHRVNSGFVVRLQYLAPDTVPPMLDRLRALLRDPGLTSG